MKKRIASEKKKQEKKMSKKVKKCERGKEGRDGEKMEKSEIPVSSSDPFIGTGSNLALRPNYDLVNWRNPGALSNRVRTNIYTCVLAYTTRNLSHA